MVSRRKLPPLNALRAFEVSGRRLNFRLASEELGVTQGAVAQQVRALEDHLGRPLFHRLTRGLSLTAAGSAYLADVTRAFDLMSEATDRLATRPDRVSISVTPTVATRLLIPRMAQLQEALPGVEFRTIANENLPDFDRDDVDIGIGGASKPFSPDLEARLLIAQEVIAVASPRLLASAGTPRTVVELSQMPLVHHCLDHWPNVLKTTQPLAGARYSLTTLAIDAALAGQGVAAVARAFVKTELEEGRLVQLFPDPLRLGPDYFIVRRRAAPHSAAAQAVWEWCLSALVG